MNKWHNNETPAERNYRIMRGWMVAEYGDQMTERVISKRFSIDKFTSLQRQILLSGGEKVASSPEFKFHTHAGIIHMDFVKYGRPTYLVSKELFDTCMELDVSQEDRSRSFEKLPYDCFALCFERGVTLRANGETHELYSIFICKNALQTHDTAPLLNAVKEKLGDAEASNLREQIAETQESFRGRPFCMTCVDKNATAGLCDNIALDLEEFTIPEGHEAGARLLLQITAALIMLWRSRPEFIVPVKLPRSERYDFKGDRSNIRTWKFPDKLIVRQPKEGESVPTGRHVKAHWRAGHFRHYRHPKFAREADGSVKVEFIAPCTVHPDELEKAKEV